MAATDTPEYAMHSVIFRRNAAALQKAAKDRNLDAATLAYTKLAFNCVECHKYLRNRKVADKTDKQIFLSGLIESLDE